MNLFKWTISERPVTYGQITERENTWRKKIRDSFNKTQHSHNPILCKVSNAEITIIHHCPKLNKILDLDNIAKVVLDSLFHSARSKKHIQGIFSISEDRVVSKLIIMRNMIETTKDCLEISIQYDLEEGTQSIKSS